MTTRRHVSDPLVVAALVAGHRGIESTIEDREEAVYELTKGGLSDPDIATRLGLTARTVQRIRKRLNIPAAVTYAGTPVAPPVVAQEPRSVDLIQHPGLGQTIVDRSDRSTGSSPFIDAFFADPFNRLVNETLPSCGDRWDIFSPPEKPDHFDYSSQAYKTAESRRKREARAICAGCPIQAECLDYSLRTGPLGGQPDEVGIWAGTTEKDRIKIHRKRSARRLAAVSMPSSSNKVGV